MAAPNLTRDQAQQRAALLDVESYAIELDLTPDADTFRSRTTVRFSSATVGASSWIDIVAPQVLRAELNGVELCLDDYREDEGIALHDLAERNELTVEADCAFMTTGEGLHRFVDPVDDEMYLYTQFETADAKRMFACFDQPDLKATFDVTVTAPEHWKVIGNAPEASNTGGRHVFETTKPMSTYLVALVAGPYAQWTEEFRGAHGEVIPLGLYCRASLAEYMDPEDIFTITKQGFACYHENFGFTYPFGKYDQCFVPEFNAGAMENVGCVTFREDYVFRSKVTRFYYEARATTILHEMAHMWFGDLVTMRWWDDLWLNESFATWASEFAKTEATRFTEAWTSFAIAEKSWAYRQDQLPSTHPVAADIADLHAVEVNFDGITYAKGASVLKQLVAFVGQDNFLAGLRTYFDRHQFGNAVLADLLRALEEASGRDLSDWGAQWLQTTGLNLMRARFEVADGRYGSFAIVQGPARPGAGELRKHRLAVGVYDFDGAGKLVRTNRIELDVDGELTEVPELVGAQAGKLVLVNDDDLTYCSVRLDPGSLATLVDHIGDFADSLPRTMCWSAAWEMTREAELKARDFLSIVLGGIEAETEISVLQRLLLQATTAVNSYTDPQWSDEGWRRLGTRLLELAKGAAPGSDHQLAFVNALTQAKLGDTELGALRGWFDGTTPLEGLTVDTDLRWRLLYALVAHGVAGEPEIAAEEQRDNTATGARAGNRARSLIPNEDAKKTAWQRAVHDDSLTNATIDAVIAGFSHPAQRQLIAGYVDRYFAEVAEVWQRRSPEAAQPVVVGLFPSWAIEEDTVRAADDWLAGDHPAALRRLVSEGRAGILRALAAREFDRS
ncbi:aminopeptidase N [Sciscionella marina]|uniref:aminopeptidase N n=1 Tax=Sciscionella marina TaxID=508770 RepID=UPI000382E787|nr:aminopeptidase N [Sciscionella marina]